MVQLLVGMLLGVMAATPTGRSIGNQIGNAAIDKVKEAIQTPLTREEDNHGDSARAD